MLELWFDFSCPYAYLASRRAQHLGESVADRGLPLTGSSAEGPRGSIADRGLPPTGSAAEGRRGSIDWRPMLLGGVFRGIGAGDGPMATISPPKQMHNVHDMFRWADHFGEPFRLPPAHPMRTVLALRTLLALPRDAWPRAIEAIFAAYWQRGEHVATPEVIAAALTAPAAGATSPSSIVGAGLASDVVSAALARADDPAIKDELRRRTDEAIGLGIFGAPAWVMRTGAADDAPPRLIWGQDRMAWVEAMRAGWSLAGPPPGGPRPFAPSAPAIAGKTLDVYFDVASPFAYLGLTQLPALAAGVRTRLVPILLGALFRDIGQTNVPWFAMPPPKQRYLGLEMQRWASWWGVPFELPRKFPQRTIAAQRLCLVAAAEGFEPGVRLATALGRAMWGEQRDLEDHDVLRTILDAEGLPAAWLDRTQDPAIKAALAANTTAAREAGVFGVPTFVVDGTHLFFGQDRLELVGKALAGWTPPTPPSFGSYGASWQA